MVGFARLPYGRMPPSGRLPLGGGWRSQTGVPPLGADGDSHRGKTGVSPHLDFKLSLNFSFSLFIFHFLCLFFIFHSLFYFSFTLFSFTLTNKKFKVDFIYSLFSLWCLLLFTFVFLVLTSLFSVMVSVVSTLATARKLLSIKATWVSDRIAFDIVPVAPELKV